MNSALLFGRRPEADHRFANAYEMAGYYARHALRLIEATGEAPVQIGFLGGEPERTAAATEHLRTLVTYNQLYDYLRQNEAGCSGVCMVTLNTRDHRRADGLLVQVHDFADGISADIAVPYAFNGSTPLMIGEPEIMDLAGVLPEERALAELGVEVGFHAGF